MSDVKRLIDVMARLRDPEDGCPWDVEQTFESIAPYTIEEAYEVDDAIRRGDLAALRDELGDLLLQVVFHARMAEEAGRFDFGDVVEAVCDKLVRRHPHVFADARVESASEQTEAWEHHKRAERAEQGATSAFDDVALGLPALLRARKLLGRARRAGLAEESANDAPRRVAEDWQGLRDALAGADRAGLETRLGELLLSLSNLARAFDLDAEAALRDATARLETRLREREAATPPE